jgi:hypothetical protein
LKCATATVCTYQLPIQYICFTYTFLRGFFHIKDLMHLKGMYVTTHVTWCDLSENPSEDLCEDQLDSLWNMSEVFLVLVYHFVLFCLIRYPRGDKIIVKVL